MAPYDDVFIRDDINDVGNIPNKNAGSKSPDLIARPSPIAPDKVQQEVGAATYGNGNLGQNIERGQINYIYVRAKNLHTAAAEPALNLYYAPNNTFNHPELWRRNLAGNAAFGQIAAGAVLAAPRPIEWLPPNDPANFCLIGQIVTGRHPNPIPERFEGIETWYSWASNNPAVAYNNLRVVDEIPDLGLEERKPLLNPDGKSRLHVIEVRCKKCPVNSRIRIYSPSTRIEPPILVETRTTSPDARVPASGILPANFQDTFTITFQPPSKPAADAEIDIIQYTEALDGETALLAAAVEAQSLGEAFAAQLGARPLTKLGAFNLRLRVR